MAEKLENILPCNLDAIKKLTKGAAGVTMMTEAPRASQVHLHFAATEIRLLRETAKAQHQELKALKFDAARMVIWAEELISLIGELGVSDKDELEYELKQLKKALLGEDRS